MKKHNKNNDLKKFDNHPVFTHIEFVAGHRD